MKAKLAPDVASDVISGRLQSRSDLRELTVWGAHWDIGHLGEWHHRGIMLDLLSRLNTTCGHRFHVCKFNVMSYQDG